MNQEAMGKFISSCRKDKGLTQMQLAEKLNITNRAVSKWETGKSIPDASVMLELCEILDISVTELLSGERIAMENYPRKADENLVGMKKETEAANKAARIGYGITLILLLVLNGVNIGIHGVQKAIAMPEFIIMQAAVVIWLLIYSAVLAKAKKKQNTR